MAREAIKKPTPTLASICTHTHTPYAYLRLDWAFRAFLALSCTQTDTGNNKGGADLHVRTRAY